ncbi:MAG: PD-(D/E)XK nuclease family protein [Leptolyngbya sp. SIOISBB]|nr:PD-(D/E)XK nuclease family protein [Leptolyngbya sp. SIOISBB]
MRLSQGQLSLLEYCPRRYQHTILESLSVPASPELLTAQQWGDRFHLLMQQREMGLPIDPVLEADTELQTCLSQLQAQAPQLFDTTGEIFRQSEHERSLTFQDYWLTGVYDLLRLWRDRAEIVDWKTYLKPQKQQHLQRDWQTRLYLYMLAETTDYPPDALAMTYWFVRVESPDTPTPAPQQVRIGYSAAAHRQTQKDLERLTQKLTDFLAMGLPFPQLPVGSDQCANCPFAVRCQRGFAQETVVSTLPSLDEIEEVPI